MAFWFTLAVYVVAIALLHSERRKKTWRVVFYGIVVAICTHIAEYFITPAVRGSSLALPNFIVSEVIYVAVFGLLLFVVVKKLMSKGD